MGADPREALEALRQRFLRRAADDLAMVLAHQSGANVSPEELKFAVHRLAGAAATFGFPDVSAAASNLEAGWATDGGIDPAGVETLVAELRRLPSPAE